MVEINLLPWRQYTYAGKLKKKKNGLIAISLLVFVVAVLVHFILMASINKLSRHTADLKKQLLQNSGFDNVNLRYFNLLTIQSHQKILHDFLNEIERASDYSL